MTVTLDFAALHYLNLWLTDEREIHEAFTTGNQDQRISALSQGAVHFRIARNLPRKFDTGKGLQRYEPILEIIDPITADDFEDDLT